MMAGSVVTVLPVLAAVPGAAALLHRGHSCGQRQGMSVRATALLCSCCCCSVVTAMRRRAAAAARRSATSTRWRTSPPWKSLASDGVSASVHSAPRASRATRWCSSSISPTPPATQRRPRQLPTTLPEDYEISFWMRAEAGRNHFEVKFVDASGDNVWWFRRANYQFSGDWQQVRIKRRQIEFAWGPTTDRTLRQFAVDRVRAQPRARTAARAACGSIAVAEAVCGRSAPTAPPTATASSEASGNARGAGHRRQGEHGVAQRATTPATQTFEIDLQARARVRRPGDRLGARAACAALLDRDVARRQPLEEGAHHRRRATAAATRI